MNQKEFDDPAALIEHVSTACMQVLMTAVHEHVPPEHRAAVLRHLAKKINLELKVRTMLEARNERPPPRKDDDQ